jgi:hypothetical protein
LLACPQPEPLLPEPDPAAGVDPAIPAGPGEARAGRVRDENGGGALFGGIAAEGAAGDFKIYNEHVQFIIQGAYHSHGYVDTGGLIIDADLVRGDGVLHRDPFDDFFISHGIGWLFHASTVEVIDPGTSGTAHVRATGYFEMWSFIHGAIEASQPILAEAPVDITVDYRLPGGSQTLEIEASFSNNSSEVARFNPSFGYLGSDEDLDPWASGLGLNPPSFSSADALGVVDRWGGATFSIWREEGPIEVMGLQDLASQAGLSGTADGWTDLESGDTLVLRRNLTIADDPLSAERIRRTALGESLGTVAGRVTESGSDIGIAGARVHFLTLANAEGGHPNVAGFARSDDDGYWSAELPPGDWQVFVTGRGRGQLVDLPAGAGRYAPYADPEVNARQLDVLAGTVTASAAPMARGYLTPPPSAVSVSAGSTATLDLELEAAGSIRILSVDDEGNPVPSYAEIRWEEGSGPQGDALEGLHETLGIRDEGSLYVRLWNADGDMSVAAPPGTYSVHVSYSWRHERVDAESVLVESGSETEVHATLSVAVAPDGWLAMDSHLHAAPSNDGSLGMEDRLIACAATGVQIPVTTDHDRISDYRPLTGPLGLDELMNVISGVEVSSVVRGHFNLFPVDPKPMQLTNGGAPVWWDLPDTTDDLMALIRQAGTEDSMVQVNHGRSGMFDFSSYHPASGTATAEKFSWDFDLFELMNSSNVAARELLRRDYYSFLNQGLLKVPTGVSDSHTRTSPCGLARTDVFLGSDSPGEVSPAALREALLAGHVVVSSGPTLRVTAGQNIPGDVLEGGQHTLAVVVSGPSYIQPDIVRLVRNGEVVDSVTVDASTFDNGLWIATDFVTDDSEDAWYVVEVEGATAMGHVWKGATPYAITGAFLVDVAGDGWEAPGL